MSIKLDAELEARYALLTDHLIANPNTPLKYAVLEPIFGEDEAKKAVKYLGRFFDSTNSRAQGKRRKFGDTERTIYFYLDQLSVPTGRNGTLKGAVYRCAAGTYVYDPEATYRVGGGIKNNRFPIYYSSRAVTPPKAAPDEASAPEPAPDPHPGAPEQQLQLPFPPAGGAPEPSELATTLIEADRANRESQGYAADTPPEERRPLPVFPQFRDPFGAKVLARGDETIVIQTATEVITATIVVAVPR